MIQFVATSDFHLSSKYPLATAVNPLKDIFFKYAYAGAKQTIQYAIDHEMDIMHGGDWFDHERPASPAVFISFLLFNMIGKAKSKLNMYINLGNHEIDYKEGVPSVLQSFTNQHPNIYSHQHKQPWNVHHARGIHIYMMPYFTEAIFNDHLENLCKTSIFQPACLLIHQNIKGIQLGRTSIKDSNISASYLSDKLKKQFKFIVCGHLHHSSYINKFGFPIVIPGSTCAVDFRDEGNEKSFYVLTLDDKYNLVDVKKEVISNQVKFQTISLSDISQNFFSGINTKFIKIKCDIGQLSEYAQIQERLIKAGAIGVTHDIVRQWNTDGFDPQERPVNMKIDEWLRYYLKSIGLSEEAMDWIAEFDNRIFGKE